MLYHRRLGFPASLELPMGKHRIFYSSHSIRAAADDFIFDLPMYVDFSKCRVIEAEVDNGRLYKVLVRFNWGENVHLVLALKIDSFGPLICKTLFVNHKFDHHKTLRRHLYTVPQKEFRDDSITV